MTANKNSTDTLLPHNMFAAHSAASFMLRGPAVTRAPDDDSGHDAAAAERAAAEAEDARVAEEARVAAEAEAAKKTGPDAETAKLLKDVMKWKAQAREAEAKAKEYEGIDPAKARAALAAQVEAERKGMEARGEYERIIEQVSKEAGDKVTAAEARVAEVSAQLDALQRTIENKDVAAQFTNSHFVRENLLISGSKVQVLYGDHFDVVDGETVPYDKPRGAKDRTPLVDGTGKALSFEAAVEKIVKADPDYERLTKSNLKKGPGSHSSNIDPTKRDVPLSSRDMIAKGLSSIKKTSLLPR